MQKQEKKEGDSAFEKRVKRRISARDHTFYLSTAPGLGGLLAEELEACLGMAVTRVTGGVEFTARLESMWKAALNLRLANRILVRLASFPADGFSRLERRVAEIPWELWLPADADIEVVVTTHHCRLYHTGAVAERVQKVVGRALEGGGKGTRPQKIYVRGDDDRFVLSLDAVGTPLYKRHVKTHGGRAPIRETLAAAVLAMAGYHGEGPLVDPMCGTGTFSLEAAMVATGTPAGIFRSFAFQAWPSFKERGFAHLKRQGEAGVTSGHAGAIFASDVDAGAVGRLTETLAGLPFGGVISPQVGDFFTLDPASLGCGLGLVLFNPPYGMRLREGSDAMVPRIMDRLFAVWGGWKMAMAIPREQVPRPLPAGFHEHPMSHGGLDLSVIVGSVPSS